MANQCKYYKQVLQVSYDSGVTWVNIGETRKGDLYEYNSPACGAVTEYRWVDVTGQYTCDGTTKYQKTKRQYSEDGGQTWSDVSPAEYGKGDVIEYASSDCGYVPPTPVGCDDYLTFVAEEAGTFRFSGATGNDSISYSLDGGSTWYTLARGVDSPTVASGNKIMWKGNLTPIGYYGVGQFDSSGRFQVEGNIMSLLFGDDFADKTDLTGYYCAFEGLFNSGINQGNRGAKVTSAEHLCLPATTLAEGCYYGMFIDCVLLTTPPSILPATTLAETCYTYMFARCTSLTTAPSLPATELAERCYYGMFIECSSLTVAPDLPAHTLAARCYTAMFSFCTSLNYIKCLATDISAYICTDFFTNNVAATGTFVKNASMNDWTTGVNGIPTNWTVQNA